jgi:hypothetical protein
MERFRSASRWVAAVWLISQLVALAASTTVLRATATTVAAVVEHCECTGTAGTCPMHPHTPASRGDGQCGMRSCSIPDATLVATATVAGVMPRLSVPYDDAVPVALLARTDVTVDRPDRPDSPPPRA